MIIEDMAAIIASLTPQLKDTPDPVPSIPARYSRYAIKPLVACFALIWAWCPDDFIRVSR